MVFTHTRVLSFEDFRTQKVIVLDVPWRIFEHSREFVEQSREGSDRFGEVWMVWTVLGAVASIPVSSWSNREKGLSGWERFGRFGRLWKQLRAFP